MKKQTHYVVLGALLSTLVGSALAIPPLPVSHPKSYLTNQATVPVSWNFKGYNGDAVYVTNHPTNPVLPQESHVEFDFEVPALAYGVLTLTWGNNQHCTFNVGSGGVSNVSSPSTDPNYSCDTSGHNFGVYPTS